jgi:hypothetical protein
MEKSSKLSKNKCLSKKKNASAAGGGWLHPTLQPGGLKKVKSIYKGILWQI